MKLFKINNNKRYQSYFLAINTSSGILFLLLMLLLSNFAYASCVDETGLGPIQIKTAANNKQIQILKKVTSKQSAKNAISKLKECKKQKLKLNSIFGGDMEVWARTEAKGDKNKEHAFTQQFKLFTKSIFGLIKQLQRIKKEFPEFKMLQNMSMEIFFDDANKVKYPEKSLLGHWYALSDFAEAGKRRINTEFQFMKDGFAVIDPALVHQSGVTYSGNNSQGTQEVVKWNIEIAKNHVPLSMSMGKSNKELKNFSWYLIKLKFMSGKPERIKGSKKGGMRTKYLTKTASISFIVNFKTGVLLLRNNYNKKRAATHSDIKLYREKALPENSNYFFKRWPEHRQTLRDENKKLISELCAKWKKESIKNPYCKKMITAIDLATVKIKEYVPTSNQKKSMLAAKKLTKVASQHLFQPIKDYSDSAPIPTSLPYDSNATLVCIPDLEAWQAKRKKMGFANTLWSLQVSSNHYRLQPGGNKEEYLQYMKALTLWTNIEVNVESGDARGSSGYRHIVHLRQDGVFGLSWSPTYKVVVTAGKAYLDTGKERPRMYYDPANRWVHKGNNLVELYWQNSKQAYSVYWSKAKYESFVSRMITSSSLLSVIVKSIPGWIDLKSPEYTKLVQIANEEIVMRNKVKNEGLCHNSKTSSSATSPQTQKIQQVKSPKRKDTKVKTVKPTVVNPPPTVSPVGCWKWSNGANIVIDANGNAHNGPVNAKWKTINKAQASYKIIWPPILDTLTLSKNGKALSGSNSFGFPITAKRKTGNGSNLFGRWLWSNGTMVDIHPDNSVSVAHFRGKVRKSGKSWIIEWPVDDAITLSKDGLNLSAKNQFGSVTAKRDNNCK